MLNSGPTNFYGLMYLTNCEFKPALLGLKALISPFLIPQSEVPKSKPCQEVNFALQLC